MREPHFGSKLQTGISPMNEPESLPQPLLDLIDDYLDGLLDEARTAELEESLVANAGAREYFVRYARLHTDLHIRQRARQASQRVLDRIAGMSPANHTCTELAARPVALRRAQPWIAMATACVLLLAL